nr:unnamed protein product [Callosobruchus analis]
MSDSEIPQYSSSEDSFDVVRDKPVAKKRRKKVDKQWKREQVFSNKALAEKSVKEEGIWSFYHKNVDTEGNTELSGIKWRKLTWCDSGGGGGGGLGASTIRTVAAAATQAVITTRTPPPPDIRTCRYHCSASEPLEDPVLRSYARCLAADILCVWRRASTPARSAASQQPQDVYDLGAGMPPPPQQHHHQPPPLSLAAAKELWIFWYGEEPDLSELIAPEINMTDIMQGPYRRAKNYVFKKISVRHSYGSEAKKRIVARHGGGGAAWRYVASLKIKDIRRPATAFSKRLQMEDIAQDEW